MWCSTVYCCGTCTTVVHVLYCSGSGSGSGSGTHVCSGSGSPIPIPITCAPRILCLPDQVVRSTTFVYHRLKLKKKV